MKLFLKLTIISIIAGALLAMVLKIAQLTLGVQSYVLLFNMDYIPILKNFEDITGSGFVFHFLFCFISVIFLYYLARMVHLESNVSTYVIVFTVGSGILYFLTIFTNEPPSATSFESWFLWVVAHGLFGIIVGFMIHKWITTPNEGHT